MPRSLLLLALTCWLSAADLGERLAGALAQVPRGGEAAVAVWDCRSGKWAAVAGDPGPLRLASTTKLLVAAAALRELGPHFQFITRLFALGPVQGGATAGIGIIGGGDPTLDEHFWRDPEDCFRQWAARIRAAGVTRVDGDLVIDNRLFSGPIRPATYPADASNQVKWYSAPASAFAFNDNCIDVRVVPTSPGSPCKVEIRPRSPRVQVENRARTTTDQVPDFSIARAADANAVTVTGTCSATTAWNPVAIRDDPDLLAGDALAAALRDAGISLAGQVRIGPVDPRRGPVLVDHHSDLVPAVTLMNQDSQNFYGEQLLRLVAVRGGGTGSIEAGTRAVMASVAPLMGDDATSVRLLDGSGLSYGNVASARALCRLLGAMDGSELGAIFAASLKDVGDGGSYPTIPGVAGRIKTGTLATTACLAGFVEGRGHRLAFTVLLGKGEADTWAWGPGLRKRLYEVIAEAAR